MAVHRKQRALPHPRNGRPADFLFVIAGTRIGASRIRHGTADAVQADGLTDPTGAPLRITLRPAASALVAPVH